LWGTVKVLEPEFPLNGLGVPVKLVTAEVPIGFVVLQVKVGVVQLVCPDAIVQDPTDGLRLPVISVNVPKTVQLPVIAPVV
jgi:hypothetical protein